MMLKILQINLNRSGAAHDAMEDKVKRERIDLCIISEANQKIARRKSRRDDGWLSEENGDTAIWWTGQNKSHRIEEKHTQGGMSAMILTEGVMVASCYFSPNKLIEEFKNYLNELKEWINSARCPISIVAGDFNAASEQWASRQTDGRGREMEEWMPELDLYVANDGYTPTFRKHFQIRRRKGQTPEEIGDPSQDEGTIRDDPRQTGESSEEQAQFALREAWIDLTTSNRPQLIRDWKVNEMDVSHSDHHYVEFNILTGNEKPKADEEPIRWKGKTLNKQALRGSLDGDCKKLVEDNTPLSEQLIDDILKKACAEAAPPVRPNQGSRKPAYWWTPHIAKLRKTCLGARRKYVRARRRMEWEPESCEAALKTYSEAKKTLTKEITRSKRAAWNDFCDSVRNDIWGKPYKIITEKIGRRRVLIPETAAKAAIKRLFPQGENPDREHLEVEENEIPKTEAAEVMVAAERMATGKAPGPDGIPPEAVKTLALRWPQVLADLTDQTFREGVFPREWKKANLILIPKQGKKDSYRPICLLNTVAKVMETIINRRLQKHLDETDGISDRQYGFRPGRSTLEAIDRVMAAADEQQSKHRVSRMCFLIILLDVRNAFNSISWKVVLDSLKRREVPAYLRRIIGSYLNDRRVSYEGQEYAMTAGVPQGSVLGPTLWNVAYDDVLRIALPEGAETVAYADDLAVMVKARKIGELEEIANQSLEVIADWMKKNSLTLAPEKTEAVMLVKRRAERLPKLTLEGHEIAIKNSAKYLGVILQPRLTCTLHVRSMTTKAIKFANAISSILPRTRGATEGQRRLLATVAESMVMYAAPVWAPYALQNSSNAEALDRTQRIMGIRITRCYRTTSTEAILVLARTIPWSLLAEERSLIYEEIARLEEEEPGGNGGEENSIETIKGNTMDKWQARWDTTEKGRWTHRCIPNVRAWCERKHGELTYATTQVLTAHGDFGAFLERFKLADTATCRHCDQNTTDDVEHTVFKCPAWNYQRGTMPKNSVPALVQYMLENDENWREVTTKLDNIMKSKQERSRRPRATRAPTEADDADDAPREHRRDADPSGGG